MESTQPYNAVSRFVDANVQNGFGDKPAFIDSTCRLSYKGLQVATMKFANVLSTLGIRREARIGMLMFDTVDFPVVYWGAMRAGVIPVCMNTLLTRDQYGFLLADSRVEALFMSEDLLPVVAPVLASLKYLRHVVVAGKGKTDQQTLDALLVEADEKFETVNTSADEVAFWLYSSGSTGDPKGVMHVHSSLQYVAEHFGAGVLGIRNDDICFSAAKLFFAYAQGAAMAIPMSVGATTILLEDRPTPQSVLKTLKTCNPTLFFGVPTLYASMLADPCCKPENCSKNLRLCISAGEALRRNVGLTWKNRMGVDIVDGVGSTEMLNAFLSNRPGEIRYGTSGREFDGYQLKLINEFSEEVGDGELGELVVCGGSAAEGYWNQREKTRSTFNGKWVCTGDKYYRDEDGYYHYCGRTNDMFKVSGRWVSPFEVEQALVSHPSVLEAAVVACEDHEGLVKPKAWVVLSTSSQEAGLFETLKGHVKSSIGPWKYPRWIEFVPELPKTATGKIQRYKLRK